MSQAPSTTTQSRAPSTSGDATSERREIDLTRAADLELFLVAIEEINTSATQVHPRAAAEEYRSLGFDGVRGEEIFSTLQDIYHELKDKILSCKKLVNDKKSEVDDVSIEQMQELYNNLVLLRDHILETYEWVGVVPTSHTSADGRPVESKSETRHGMQHRDEQVDRLYTGIERVVQGAEKHLEKVQARVLNRISPAMREGEASPELEELKACAVRISGMKDRIEREKESVTDVPVLTATLEKYSSAAAEITAHLDEITAHLDEIDRQIADKQVVNIVPQTSPAASEEPNRSSSLKERVVPQIVSEASVPNVPTDAEVVALMKQVTANQFFSDVERGRARELCESYHRDVASGRSPSIVEESYAQLQQYVEQLLREPGVTELHERASRIIQRMTAGLPYDSEVLRKARTLEYDFRQALSDPEKSDQEVRGAYQAFEYYAVTHETKWLAVCGQPIPAPGKEGIPTARRLRETLLTERDRNRELVQDPRKQVLVDKLIRKLSVIPPDGLSAEGDVSEIVELVRAIDVPGQQAGLRRVDHRPEETAETAVEKVTNLGVESPTHRVIQIAAENDEDGNIAIRVAKQAKERLEQSRPKKKQRRKKKGVSTADAQLVTEPIKRSDQKMIAKLEGRDPVSSTVPAYHASVMRPKTELAAESLTGKYLMGVKLYRDFISEVYTSPAAYERILDSTITKIETQTDDVFERWLHEDHASPFLFLQGMTIREVLEFGAERDLRELLKEKGIKYEAFLAWFDMLDEMRATVGENLSMTFGELFARWMIESEILYVAEQLAS